MMNLMLLMSVLQYSINVRIVNSIIILGLNCKPLISSNESKLKYFKYVENKVLYENN